MGWLNLLRSPEASGGGLWEGSENLASFASCFKVTIIVTCVGRQVRSTILLKVILRSGLRQRDLTRCWRQRLCLLIQVQMEKTFPLREIIENLALLGHGAPTDEGKIPSPARLVSSGQCRNGSGSKPEFGTFNTSTQSVAQPWVSGMDAQARPVTAGGEQQPPRTVLVQD